jgi:hypothetical protein
LQLEPNAPSVCNGEVQQHNLLPTEAAMIAEHISRFSIHPIVHNSNVKQAYQKHWKISILSILKSSPTKIREDRGLFHLKDMQEEQTVQTLNVAWLSMSRNY